jgi:hypothetical protein
MLDMKEIISMPVIPLSLMLSAVYTILTFLIMLIVAPLMMLIIQGAAIAAVSTSSAVSELGGLGALGIIGIILMIILTPIVVFIITFVYSALFALLYNFLAPKMGGIRLKFSSVALILAMVTTILNFLFSIPQIVMYFAVGEPLVAVGYLLSDTVGYFIIIFITYAIMTLLYNFLRPKIGGVELELE